MEGDHACYKQFLERVAVMVRGYLAKSLGRDRAAHAEDLVQDVLLAIHKKKHLYDPARPVLPWIFAVARYRLIDSFRSESRRPRLAAWEEGMDFAEQHTDGDAALAVEELLEGLNERQRRILVMSKLEGRPLAEVAGRMGMSVSAVKVAVHRTLRSLRKKHGGAP